MRKVFRRSGSGGEAPGAGAGGSPATSSPPPPEEAEAAQESEALDSVGDLQSALPSVGAKPDLPAGRMLQRQYSLASKQTVDTLQTIELQIVDLERQTSEHHDLIESGAELPPELRNKLAQLHGDANRILAVKVDAILTSDLNSGRDDARATRKALIKRLEALIERLEALVKKYDQIKAERSASAEGA